MASNTLPLHREAPLSLPCTVQVQPAGILPTVHQVLASRYSPDFIKIKMQRHCEKPFLTSLIVNHALFQNFNFRLYAIFLHCFSKGFHIIHGIHKHIRTECMSRYSVKPFPASDKPVVSFLPWSAIRRLRLKAGILHRIFLISSL